MEQKQRATRHDWDNEAATFDNEPDHGLHPQAVCNAWTNLLAKSLPPSPASVLDIGCGTGSLSIVLAGLHYDVTGIDLSAAMIARANAKIKAAQCNITFLVMDAFIPDFPLHKFDVIVCRHLLWALPDSALALRRWSNILTPGGRLVLIEGRWHTGSGLSSQQVVAALPNVFTNVTVKNLSDQPDLWNGTVTDERYLVIADKKE